MNPNSQTQKRNDGIKFIRAFALIFIGTIIFLFWFGGGFTSITGRFTVTPSLQNYLKDKYSQEFVVKDLHITGAGLGVPGTYRATAHPKSDLSLTFEVGKGKSTGKFFDGYSGAVWAREERPRVESFLETVYSPLSAPEFNLTTHIPTSADPDPIRGTVPSINSAMSQYQDNFLYFVTIHQTTDHELSQSELDGHVTKIEQIIDFVLAKDISYPMVRYAINIDEQDAGYLCHLSKDKLTDQDSINGCLTKTHGKAW